MRLVIEVPEHPELRLWIYGKVHASNLSEVMAQGYAVALNGVPTPRSELSDTQRKAVKAVLEKGYPEHAKI